MANAYYATQTQRTLNTGELPMLSHGLESYRAYQWEVEIDLPAGMSEGEQLTLAAKQVSQIGFASEDIVVDRVNDKFHYPGKVTPESVTITFDNLVKGDTASKLYGWMQNTYDPITGTFTPQFLQGNGGFKSHIRIYQLDNAMFPVKHIHLYGAYPKSWKLAEFNYSTNEFHTIEVEIRYDFAVQYSGLE
jgi:phosphate-selective porin